MSSITVFSARFIAFVSLAFFAHATSAQSSMSILGQSSLAHECFDASTLASRFESASYSDIEVCTKAINHELLNRDDLIATYVNRGIIYVALEKYDRAQEDYEKAARMGADVPATFLNRGNLWFLAQQYERAIQDYTLSLDLNLAERHIALLNRGLAYEYMGNLTQAETDYLASLDLRPEWELAQEKLARVERKMAN